jgi:hypothetical protein
MTQNLKNKVLLTQPAASFSPQRTGFRVPTAPGTRGRTGGLTRQQATRAQASLTQAVRRGALVGPEAAFMALVVQGNLQARGPAASPSTAVASLPIALTQRLLAGTAAEQEAALYMPHLGAAALSRVATGELSFAQILTLVPPKVAEKMLQDRQKAIQAFFDSWGESLRENAERDKQAAQQSQERALQSQRLDASRAELKLQQKAAGRQKMQLRYQGIYAAAASLHRSSPGAFNGPLQATAAPAVLDRAGLPHSLDRQFCSKDATPFRPAPRAPEQGVDASVKLRRRF